MSLQFSVAPTLGSLEKRRYKSAHGKTQVGKKSIQSLECYSKETRYLYLGVAWKQLKLCNTSSGQIELTNQTADQLINQTHNPQPVGLFNILEKATMLRPPNPATCWSCSSTYCSTPNYQIIDSSQYIASLAVQAPTANNLVQ